MEQMTLRELVQATGGKLLGACTDESIPFGGVKSDNRKVEEGDLFVAFVGENTDGHKYVAAALDMGAAGALISKDPGDYAEGKFYVLVEDTYVAVGKLAAYYRNKFDIPVIGVTGSVGKTTTKDMIAAVLSEKFNVLKTEANFNNYIGVPRTLFRLSRETEIAVVEMGMNHLEEIDYLTKIAQPTVVTITNVGTAHIGNLGSRENIYKAKTEIFNGLRDGGFAVMIGDDDYLPLLKKDEDKQKHFTFAWVGEGEDNDYRAKEIQDTLQEKLVYKAVTPEGSYQVDVPALGHHLIYPTLTAAAIGAHFGMTNEEIARGIANYHATAQRMEKTIVGEDILLYNDTYNANPQSMIAGLTTLSNTTGYTHVAVLGDMFELGDLEEELHREVGKACAEKQIDTLIAIGEASKHMADEAAKCGMKDVRAVMTREEALEEIQTLLAPKTAFLFKASHGMHLDELVAKTKELAQ